MRNAARLLTVGIGALALLACGGKQPQQASADANQDLSIDGNVVAGQLPENAEIETLPPDESSETSSGELQRGDDNPDVATGNAVTNSH